MKNSKKYSPRPLLIASLLMSAFLTTSCGGGGGAPQDQGGGGQNPADAVWDQFNWDEAEWS